MAGLAVGRRRYHAGDGNGVRRRNGTARDAVADNAMTAPTAASDDVVIEGYRSFELIGTGGFSRVYRAFQTVYHRKVAVKVLNVGELDQHAQRRFERECSVTGRLTGHPHIVTVLDSGFTDSGSPYLTMEYFSRGSIAERLRQERRLDLATTLDLGVKLAGALETAHRSDILHRDIKPQNVLVSGYGEPALADFGISSLTDGETSSTTDTLTPVHAAPEVIEANASSPRSDVYSLGSTLYSLLAGRAPFAREGEEGIMPLLVRIMREPVPPLPDDADGGPEIEDVLRRSLAKDPAARYATAARLGEALQEMQMRASGGVTPLLYPEDERDPVDDGPSDIGPPLDATPDPAATSEDRIVVADRIVVDLDDPPSPPQPPPRRPGSITIDVDDLDVGADPIESISLRQHLPRPRPS